MKALITLAVAFATSTSAGAQVAKGNLTVGSTFLYYNVITQSHAVEDGELLDVATYYGGWSFWPTLNGSYFVSDRISVGLAIAQLSRLSRGSGLTPYARIYFMRNKPARDSSLVHQRLLPVAQLSASVSVTGNEGIGAKSNPSTSVEHTAGIGGQLSLGLSYQFSSRFALECMLGWRTSRYWRDRADPTTPTIKHTFAGGGGDVGVFLALSYFIRR
jgi:hypothetical protein